MKKIKSLVKKELMDIMRDKKTLAIMVIMPVLLYPLLVIGITVFMNSFMQNEESKLFRIGYDSVNENIVKELREVLDENKEDIDYDLEFVASTKDDEENVLWLNINETDNKIEATVDYASAKNAQNFAAIGLKQVFEIYREELVKKNLEGAGLNEDFIYPVSFERNDTSSLQESIGINMGGSLGMMLIMMLLLSAFYPAVDVTTGERERGTLETLLTLPVSNFQMIMSKFIAVSIVAGIAAILSLISLMGSVVFLMTGLSDETVFDFSNISVFTIVSTIFVLLLVVITASLLMTAFSMCFCVFAKTNKEANNYMTPIMLIVMIASMVGMIPTVTISAQTSLIPLVNVSLLIKSLVASEMNLGYGFTTVLVNGVFSILVIWVLSKLYDSETVLFAEGFKNVKLFQKRSDIKPGTIPAVGDVVLGIAVMLLLLFYVGTMVSMKDILAGAVVTQLLIISVPLFFVWYMKTNVKEFFALKAPKFGKNIFGSIMLYIGTFIAITGLSPLLVSLFEDSAENLGEGFGQLLDHPFILCVFVIAVMPAICEEIFFRGMVFGSFRNKYSLPCALIASSVIFGLYHMSIVKLLTTTLLGLTLAYVYHITGSLFVSMTFHFINNLISLLIMRFGDKSEFIMKIFGDEQLSYTKIAVMIVLGTVFAAAGLLLTKNASKKDMEK